MGTQVAVVRSYSHYILGVCYFGVSILAPLEWTDQFRLKSSRGARKQPEPQLFDPCVEAQGSYYYSYNETITVLITRRLSGQPLLKRLVSGL